MKRLIGSCAAAWLLVAVPAGATPVLDAEQLLACGEEGGRLSFDLFRTGAGTIGILNGELEANLQCAERAVDPYPGTGHPYTDYLCRADLVRVHVGPTERGTMAATVTHHEETVAELPCE
jgi:hypothetical protein